MRRKIIAGNWKMNKLPNEALDFITELEPLVKNSENEIVLCVPYIDLFYTLLNAQGTNIKILSYFSLESLQTRRQYGEIFQVLRGRATNREFLHYPSKVKAK